MTGLRCVASWGNHGLAASSTQSTVRVQYQRRIGRPLCGDVIGLEQQQDKQWLVNKIESRRNHFARADRKGRPQLLAANIDQAIVVIAPEPAPSRDLIDRYLAANEILGIRTTLVLNKVDLSSQDLDQLRQQLSIYIELGYTVIECSTLQNHGIDTLKQQLADESGQPRCSLFVGQSGVGKSSLLNCLVPDLSIQVNSLSTATGKGKHTTTTSKMYFLPGESDMIIDSPGVWEYGLWRMPGSELAYGFLEFRDHLGQCRFQDCQHNTEPQCALQSQADQSTTFEQRLQCYRRLLAEQQRFASFD